MLKIKNSIGKEIRKNLSIRQYSSASCCKDTALVAALSCTSYLKLSLHTILMFIRCWLETYRCFLNNIAAYLQEKRKKTNINCLFVTSFFFRGLPGVSQHSYFAELMKISEKEPRVIIRNMHVWLILKPCPSKGRFFQKVGCIFRIAQKMCRKLSWKRDWNCVVFRVSWL